jgi:capsular polysaccharide export protein
LLRSRDSVVVDRSTPLPFSPAERLLRIPPFPGTKSKYFGEIQSVDADWSEVADAMQRLRVGGAYWGAQPELEPNKVVVRVSKAWLAANKFFGKECIPLWQAGDQRQPMALSLLPVECDPWHVLSTASAVVIDRDDEFRVIAALQGIRRYVYNPVSGRLDLDLAAPSELMGQALSGIAFENPFTGERMSTAEAVELCGFWRRLIDSNRGIGGAVGVAFWKQSQVAPLLWSGGSFKFLRGPQDRLAGSRIAVWRSKALPVTIAELDRKKVQFVEVEDGFLRSRGLGADCVPPLSITADCLGAYFDPAQPSELEKLLQGGSFDAQILARARKLRRLVVEAGIGKYGLGAPVLERPVPGRRHILVPGQVEDDRAVQAGGCGLVSNLELLRRVRQQVPDAFILYKPHPDVAAGHRRGAVRQELCLEFADSIVSDVPIASLISMVDEVHVNTSLAGFEALLRDTPVTTYGVPFYSGWGLTTDLGPVPQRRTTRRNVDELVAATLLIYPRYLDPATGLPCPAEVVVARLAAGEVPETGVIVGMRRLQGRVMRRLRSLVQ